MRALRQRKQPSFAARYSRSSSLSLGTQAERPADGVEVAANAGSCQELAVALHDYARFNARNIDKASLYTFYRTWEAPRLQILSTRNILPYHVKGAVLTGCTIELDRWVEWVTFPLILSFLMSCPSLRTLLLASSQASIMNIPPNIPELQNESVVVLQSLEEFSLTLDTDIDPRESNDEDLLSGSSIRRFLDSLITPNLVTLEVALKTKVLRLLELLIVIVFGNNRYPTASNVKVALRRTEFYTPLVWYPLYRRPGLADLTLEFPDMYLPDCYLPDFDGDSEFASFTRLTFLRCYYARGPILARVIGDIWECKGITLRHKCVPLKVVFEDCPIHCVKYTLKQVAGRLEYSRYSPLGHPPYVRDG